MTDRKITNLPASIRQRLLQVARDSARPFQEVLQYYAMERFLYRLSVSPHSEKFVLKGALMLVAWGVSSSRPTRDIDLLGFLPKNVDTLVSLTNAGKAAQWHAFTRKLRVSAAAPDLANLCQAIAEFLSPPSIALLSEQPFRQAWRKGGPWMAASEKRG